ncbi:MAG TPA: helix-turn-helix domain-containing protein [Kribbella sp.]|nr:helix-turn-helix domain-containing protein [Kribbella sp.]
MTDTELAALAAWAEDRLPQLTEDACIAILARIPFYRGAQVVPVADLRRSVGHNLRFLVTAIREPHAPLDLRAPKETGRRRAQQSAPLPEVLQAYRVCFATLWDALVAHARHDRQPAAVDALLSAASLIWQLTDEHAIAVTEAYRAATAELLLARQQRRSALVEALLTGHPGPEGGPWEAASLLGLPPDSQLVVVAAETRGLAEESLPGIEKHLAGCGVVSGWRLTPALQVGLIALPVGQPDSVLSVLSKVASARTGVSPPYRSLSDTPRALQLARTALAAVPAGRTEVHLFDSSPLAAMMAIDPGEGRRIANDVLGAVLALPADDRAVLLDTLNAYLDHDGSAEHAGDVLHCHPNTVRYRLRRLQDLTKRSLSDPREATELAAASYAVRLVPMDAQAP